MKTVKNGDNSKCLLFLQLPLHLVINNLFKKRSHETFSIGYFALMDIQHQFKSFPKMVRFLKDFSLKCLIFFSQKYQEQKGLRIQFYILYPNLDILCN